MSRSSVQGKSARKMDAAGGVVLLAITAAVAVALVLPAWGVHQRSIQAEARLAVQQQAAAKADQTLESMQRQYHQARQAVANHPLHLSPTGALNERLSQVTALAAAHGLEVDGIQPGPAQSAPHYVRQPIRMSGGGDFEAAVRFLHALHEQLPDIAVRSLRLSGSPGQVGSKPKFIFELRWFAAPGAGS